jgi:hypothetical protein
LIGGFNVTVREPELMQDNDTRQQMIDLMFGYQLTQAVRAAADLSLVDHLAGGSLTAAEVAEREDSAADATFRLMLATVAVGRPARRAMFGSFCFRRSPRIQTLGNWRGCSIFSVRRHVSLLTSSGRLTALLSHLGRRTAI